MSSARYSTPIFAAAMIGPAFRFCGVAGVIMMQYSPFADAKALAVYDTFERALAATAEGKRRSPGQQGRIDVAVDAPGLLGVADPE